MASCSASEFSGFYDDLRREERGSDPEHEEMLAWVQDLAEASDHTDGSPRMAKALQALGYRVGRYQARRLMREACAIGAATGRANSNHRQAVFENRQERNFAVDTPNQVFAGDITDV